MNYDWNANQDRFRIRTTVDSRAADLLLGFAGKLRRICEKHSEEGPLAFQKFIVVFLNVHFQVHVDLSLCPEKGSK